MSTYLSHESKGSSRSRNHIGSVSDLLDVSIGSDEVFTSQTPTQLGGSIVGE